jgi:hypothetical protein
VGVGFKFGEKILVKRFGLNCIWVSRQQPWLRVVCGHIGSEPIRFRIARATRRLFFVRKRPGPRSTHPADPSLAAPCD